MEVFDGDPSLDSHEPPRKKRRRKAIKKKDKCCILETIEQYDSKELALLSLERTKIKLQVHKC